MKQIICRAWLLSALLMTGCIDYGSVIVDWAPVHIFIEAVNDEGDSILSPDMPGMTLTFKGQTYSVKEGYYPVNPPTRDYLPEMYGLVAQAMYEVDGQTVYRLCFGEIDGSADMDENILLHWPDGTEDIIHYHCSNHRTWPSVDCKRSWKLNGEEHEGGTFHFTGKTVPN